MKTLSKILNQAISLLMIVQLVSATTASAGMLGEDDMLKPDFDGRCKNLILLDKKFKEASCASSPSAANCKSLKDQMANLGGENTLGFCQQTDVALKASGKEKIKFWTYTTTAATCGALAWFSVFTVGTSELVCSGASIAAGITGIAMDIKASKEMKKAASEYENSCKDLRTDFKYVGKGIGAGSAGLAGATTGIWHAAAGGKELFKATATDAAKKTAGASAKAALEKFGCVVCAASFAIMAGISKASQVKIEKVGRTSVDQANLMSASFDDQKNGMSPTFSANYKDNKGTGDQTGGGGSSNTGNGDDDCLASNNSGSQVEQCIAKQVPEVAAIINDKALMNQIKSNFKGKGLGDLLKEGKDKPNFNEHLANAMGVSPKSMDKLMGMNEKFGKDAGLKDKIDQSYAMHGFGSSLGGGAGASKSESGYGNGNASAVTSNLSDAAFGATEMNGEEPNVDPAEALYRQLDLMTPEQVHANTKISLFVRIAHRYRKNVEKVEKLNSALEVRTPASVKK